MTTSISTSPHPILEGRKCFNFTPHSISLYKRTSNGDQQPSLVATIPSHGSLRLLEKDTVVPLKDASLLLDDGSRIEFACEPYVQFDRLDYDSHAWDLVLKECEGGAAFTILVSMPVGQYFASNATKFSKFHYFDCDVLGPNTGDAHRCLDGKKNLIGTFCLTKYAQFREGQVEHAAAAGE